MRNRLWMFLAILFLIVSCGAVSGASSTSAAKYALDHTVSIEIGVGETWLLIGSGVAVKGHDVGKGILTAAHVAMAIPNSVDNVMKYRACSAVDATACIDLDTFIFDSSRGPGGDWALYPVDEFPKGTKRAFVVNGNPSIGTEVVVAGYPEGNLWVNFGTIAIYRGSEGDLMIGVAAFGRGGSSGGGVFDMHGRLIGIVTTLPIYDNVLGQPEAETSQLLVVPAENVVVL